MHPRKQGNKIEKQLQYNYIVIMKAIHFEWDAGKKGDKEGIKTLYR